MDRTAKRKALSAWSKAVRDRDQKCVICDRTDHLNAHHILPKENYKEFMLDPINGITLCPAHHKFSKYSAHKNPIWFAKFIADKFPEQWTWAIAHV
jgi:hypothetical protein